MHQIQHRGQFSMLAAGLTLAVGLMCAGCGGASDSAEEDLIYSGDDTNWAEIDLGHFTISVLIAEDPSSQPDFDRYQESVALHYQLHCLVEEEKVETVKQLLEENKGELSDQVIRTCRRASLIDLADPELQLIRSQLRDFTEEFIGRGVIKRFVFSDVVLERY